LIEARGGFGDGFQYGRLLPLLKVRGAYVVLQAFPQLLSVLQSLPGYDELVAPGEPCTRCDYYCRLKFLGFLLDWTWPWIAEAVPCLRVDAASELAWRRRLRPDRLNVGIIWRSRSAEEWNPYMFRSIPLAEFEALARVPGVALYGLQVGPGVQEMTSDTARWLTTNFEEISRDFADTAAVIRAMDAIVTVDTSTAHLAGALRQRCFVVLPRFPDPRWVTDAPDVKARGCPWYPSARLYLQDVPGQWTSAIARVADDLVGWTRRRQPTAS
jgi:hypothetical protein